MIIDDNVSYIRCDVCHSVCFKHNHYTAVDRWRQIHMVCGLPHIEQLTFKYMFARKQYGEAQ